MKTIFFLMLFAFLNTSCGKASDGAGGTSGADYVNQDLTGKIAGQNWDFLLGTAKISSFDSTELSLKFYNTDVSNPCDSFAMGIPPYVMTSVKNQVGETTFSIGLNGQTGDTLTLYDGTTNFIVTSGKIEILSIDLVQNLVTGRVVATYDPQYTINGNFTLQYCP